MRKSGSSTSLSLKRWLTATERSLRRDQAWWLSVRAGARSQRLKPTARCSGAAHSLEQINLRMLLGDPFHLRRILQLILIAKHARPPLLGIRRTKVFDERRLVEDLA